ncbi:hypothetical protein BKA69DRAFT_1123221 [Paraphysoderma sedebokerense]|nr:hypothetical protein BKA69DRAFT_1123221 [Paraphysoderma sedebokerense]
MTGSPNFNLDLDHRRRYRLTMNFDDVMEVFEQNLNELSNLEDGYESDNSSVGVDSISSLIEALEDPVICEVEVPYIHSVKSTPRIRVEPSHLTASKRSSANNLDDLITMIKSLPPRYKALSDGSKSKTDSIIRSQYGSTMNYSRRASVSSIGSEISAESLSSPSDEPLFLFAPSSTIPNSDFHASNMNSPTTSVNINTPTCSISTSASSIHSDTSLPGINTLDDIGDILLTLTMPEEDFLADERKVLKPKISVRQSVLWSELDKKDERNAARTDVNGSQLKSKKSIKRFRKLINAFK